MFSVHGWILYLLPTLKYIQKIWSVQIEVSRRERVHARSYVCSYYLVPKGKFEHIREIQPCKQFWETGTREDTGKNEKFWEPGEIQGTWRNLGSHWRDTGNQEKSWKPGEIQGTRRNLGSHKRYRESGEIQGIRRDTRNQEVYREPVEIQGTAREKQETRG